LTADQVEFRVIDPPLAAFTPVAPDRLVWLAAAFLAALGTGGGLCWLLAQLNPVFTSAAALREACRLPVLGAITQAALVQHRLRRRVALIGFSGAIAGLAALFAGAIALEVEGPGLSTLVRGLL
jgi:uncharacterized protein involved in exopolysaccharide biosynthesis